MLAVQPREGEERSRGWSWIIEYFDVMESLCVSIKSRFVTAFTEHADNLQPSFTFFDQPLALGGYWLQKFTNAVHWRVNIFGRCSQYFTIGVVTRITHGGRTCATKHDLHREILNGAVSSRWHFYPALVLSDLCAVLLCSHPRHVIICSHYLR